MPPIGLDTSAFSFLACHRDHARAKQRRDLHRRASDGASRTHDEDLLASREVPLADQIVPRRHVTGIAAAPW